MDNVTRKMVLIPEQLLKCLDYKGFIREVQDRIGPTKNQFNAYEDVEADMEKYFGKRKFKDYATFRVIQTRNNKNKKTHQ